MLQVSVAEYLILMWRRFWWGIPLFNKKLCYCRGTAWGTCQILQLQNISLKTGVPDLSCGIICVILRLSVLIQYRNVTNTYRQTDRHTTTAYTALSIASRCKNRPYCTAHQVITKQRASVDNIMLCRQRNVGTPHIWTIMLKLHLNDSLSICYTANFATNTVTNRTHET